MNSLICDNHQAELSRIIDDGQPLPEPLLRHLSSCDECAAFAQFCREEALQPWAGELPAASVLLRARIQILPRQKSTRRPFLAACAMVAAAVITVTTLAWWPGPGTPEQRTAPPPAALSDQEQAEIEIAALRYDLDKAFAQIAEPLSAFGSLTSP